MEKHVGLTRFPPATLTRLTPAVIRVGDWDDVQQTPMALRCILSNGVYCVHFPYL